MISSLNSVPPQQVDNLLGLLEIVRAAQDPTVVKKTLADLQEQRQAIEEAHKGALAAQADGQRHLNAAIEAQKKAEAAHEAAKRASHDVAGEQARLAEARQSLEDDRALFRAEQAAARDEVAKQEAQVRIAFAQADDLRREALALQAANQAERGDIDRLATELEAREADLNKRLDQLRALAGA
jgi:chromosome segregation ATPase